MFIYKESTCGVCVLCIADLPFRWAKIVIESCVNVLLFFTWHRLCDEPTCRKQAPRSWLALITPQKSSLHSEVSCFWELLECRRNPSAVCTSQKCSGILLVEHKRAQKMCWERLKRCVSTRVGFGTSAYNTAGTFSTHCWSTTIKHLIATSWHGIRFSRSTSE